MTAALGRAAWALPVLLPQLRRHRAQPRAKPRPLLCLTTPRSGPLRPVSPGSWAQENPWKSRRKELVAAT